MNKHVLLSVCDQPLSKCFGVSWSGFTTLFCPCKQPKLRQPLHLADLCRSDIGVLLKAPITLPSADIYRVTSITLGNTRHTAVPKLGCWKLSALQFFPSWKYTPGSGQGRVRRFKPCSWETTEMSSYKCVQALPICSSEKIWDQHLDPRWSVQSIADGSNQSTSGSVVCIYSSRSVDVPSMVFFLSNNLCHKVYFNSFLLIFCSAESTVVPKSFFWEWCHIWMTF